MKKNIPFLIIFIILSALFLGGCLSKALLQPASPRLVVSEKPDLVIHRQSIIDLSIPLADNKGALNAEMRRPQKRTSPKTLVIIVPGSGKVSRRGEVESDGLDSYPFIIEQNNLWARSLSEQDFFVFSYDKRTCDSNLCQKNPTRDIDEKGIKALAGDLDDVYKFLMSKLASESEEARVFLMTSAQGAQVVAQAECARHVQGIILLSPVIGSLEEALKGGYHRAQHQKMNLAHKNRLLNKAEEIKAFFVSLKKKGMFPDSAQIRGASIKFWHSWMDASLRTLDMLVALNRPVLVVFSSQDVFSTQDSIANNNKYLKNKRNFTIKNIENTDRNFITNGELSASAIKEVADFIKKSK